MLHETYKLKAPDQDIRYLYFPRGRDYCDNEMECIHPLHHGEDGYSETDIRVRGLPLLAIIARHLSICMFLFVKALMSE